jgi:hypothetical protein
MVDWHLYNFLMKPYTPDLFPQALPMVSFNNRQKRNQHGQALTGLIAFVGVFVICALGLFAFEISRYALAQSQLKNCVDAAALAGQATLASYSPTSSTNSLMQTGYSNLNDAYKAESAAMKAAFRLFCQNSILGESLATASLPQGFPAPGQPVAPLPNPLPAPAADQAMMFVEFVTPSQGANSTAPNAGANQRIIRVTAAYGVVPAFGRFLGLSNVPAWNSATAAVPMIDVMNAFDVSGSMDDQTRVTFVKRYWAPPGRLNLTGALFPFWHVDYQIATTPAGLPAEGPLARILGNPVRGTNVNALPPQGLENAGSAPQPLHFSESSASTRLLRGVTNTGSPPGNAPGQVMPPATPPVTGSADVFTDLVVNLDGNNHFNGYSTANGYQFPNLAVLVEAARGNLDNSIAFNSAGLSGNPYFAGVAPRPNYRLLGYEVNAGDRLLPFAAARTAGLNFGYVLLHTNNCQMGEISFSDHVGTSDLSTFNAPNVSAQYPQADSPRQGTFILPNQYEEPVTDQFYYVYKQYCTSPGARVWSPMSNVAAALSRVMPNERAAIDWLDDPRYHRPNADRAIVLFTNTAPQPSQIGAARQAASRARSLGIPIYVIGLAEDPGTQAAQLDAYNDTNPDPNTGGICGISGHGARFFQITDERDLSQAFGNVMRQLVKLAKDH